MSKLNHYTARVLTGGLLLAVTLLLAGIVLTVARPGIEAVHMASVSRIPGDIAAWRPGGFFTLGLLVLLATPILRVAALFTGFLRNRMWLFSACSFLVLVLLGLSLYLGVAA